jgi:hypothetical protein
MGQEIGEFGANFMPMGKLGAAAKAIMFGPIGLGRLSGRSASEMAEKMDQLLRKSGTEGAFKQGGVFRGYKGAPMMEIPDIGASLRPHGPEIGGMQEFKFFNPAVDIHKAYDLPPVLVHRPDPEMSAFGGATKKGGETSLFVSPEDVIADRSPWPSATIPGIAAHELQHAIQEREGWPKGFNPSMAPFTEQFWKNWMGGLMPPAGVRGGTKPVEISKMISAGLARPSETESDLLRAARETYNLEAGENQAENVRNRLENPALYHIHPSVTQGNPFVRQFSAPEEFAKMGFTIPSYAMPERGVVLGPRIESRWSRPEQQMFSHSLLDSKTGSLVGSLAGRIHANDPTKLHVDWIGAEDTTGGRNPYSSANSLGPREMRELVRSINETYPDIKSVAGYRVSGARTGRASPGTILGADADVPLKPGGLISALGER